MSEEQNKTTRREFLQGAVAGVGFGAAAAMGLYSHSEARRSHFPKIKRKMTDIGVCKSVKVTNISETSWFDNNILMGDIRKAGGLLVNQYTIGWPPFGNGKEVGKSSYAEGMATIKQYLPHNTEKAWEIQEKLSHHPDNPGGFSCLCDFEMMDGKHVKVLYDCGWSYKWMDESFKREGIDKMLQNNEIDFLFISHEHYDHYWGFPVVMKYNPNIKVLIPEGFYQEGFDYLKDSGHKGEVVLCKNGLNKLMPGVAAYTFPCPIITRVYGEQSMYVNIAGKGLVSISGCCHQGIIQFAATAYEELKYENDRFYGIYGGLHISPFEDWDPKYDDLVISLGKYNFEKIGCNHCTGLLCARKFIDYGYPVVSGTARFRTKTKDYLGNGDTITFG